jgi:heat-inducible transcriptional repressor
MPVDPNIGIRERDILTAIVETFISTGEPVGSRTLARSNREGLSPASIRNVMADLSDAGFLEQPHASAGRIPTTEAYRYNVEQISGDAGRVHDFRLARRHHRRAGVHGAHLTRALADLA